MKQIYLDHDQCKQFEVDYFEASSATLRADRILASKFNGYDEKHTRFLQEFAARPVMLERTRDDAPGWYRVMNTLDRL